MTHFIPDLQYLSPYLVVPGPCTLALIIQAITDVYFPALEILALESPLKCLYIACSTPSWHTRQLIPQTNQHLSLSLAIIKGRVVVNSSSWLPPWCGQVVEHFASWLYGTILATRPISTPNWKLLAPHIRTNNNWYLLVLQIFYWCYKLFLSKTRKKIV